MLRIRELRTERGYSQVDLARRAGVEPARLCDLEAGRGNPTIGTLDKIAAVLGVETADLIRRRDPMPA